VCDYLPRLGFFKDFQRRLGWFTDPLNRVREPGIRWILYVLHKTKIEGQALRVSSTASCITHCSQFGRYVKVMEVKVVGQFDVR
jgi:hypothetical protein